MFETNLQTMVILGVQVASVTALIVSNKVNAKTMRETINQLKADFAKLTEQVTNLRIKIGE